MHSHLVRASDIAAQSLQEYGPYKLYTGVTADKEFYTLYFITLAQSYGLLAPCPLSKFYDSLERNSHLDHEEHTTPAH